MQHERTSAGIVEKEVWIAARPEVVFPFFTDPAKMVLWKGIEATLDPRPGGVYRVNVTGRDIALGEYLEVLPFHRVVFTWGWEAEGHPVPPGSSTVEVVFIPEASGTRVRLRHYNLPEDAQGQHAEGWEHYLARLAVTSAGGYAGPDEWVADSAPR